MAGPPRKGRSGVTQGEARGRAKALEARTQEEISARLQGSPREVFSRIRGYLIRRSIEMDTRNNPNQQLKLQQGRDGSALIVLGPTFDKGPTPEHFNFDSGGR